MKQVLTRSLQAVRSLSLRGDPERYGLSYALGLACLVWLLALPRFLHFHAQCGFVYYQAGQAFHNGLCPYFLPRPIDDTYKYSPTFAWMMQFFSPLRPLIYEQMWVVLQAFLYLFGLFFLAQPAVFRGVDWFFILQPLVEAENSLIGGQINAMLGSLSVLSLRLYRQGYVIPSASLLTVLTNFKNYTGLLVLPFLLRSCERKRFWLGALATAFVVVALPALQLGWYQDVQWHGIWLTVLRREASADGIFWGTFSLGRVFLQWHWWTWAKWGPRLVLLLTFAGLVWKFPRDDQKPFPSHLDNLGWWSWMVFAFSGVLLWSPKTELATFVTVAPSFCLMGLSLHRLGHVFRWELRGAVVAGILMTYLHQWPRWFTLYLHCVILKKGYWKFMAILLLWGLAFHCLSKVRHLQAVAAASR